MELTETNIFLMANCAPAKNQRTELFRYGIYIYIVIYKYLPELTGDGDLQNGVGGEGRRPPIHGGDPKAVYLLNLPDKKKFYI